MISPARRLTHHDEPTLARLMRAGDRQAREELISRHLPLTRALALRYRRKSEPIEDLAQVAVVGLLKAVDRWDPDREIDLVSYATPTILGELRHYFRDCTWGIRPPRRLQDLALAVERSRDELRSRLGRSPTVADLACRLECDEATVLEALQARAGRALDSLDAPVHGDDDELACVGELVPVVDVELDRAETRATIDGLTSILDGPAQEILRLRYEHDLLQSEIADRIGSSQMHVSRTIRASLEKLHAYASGSMRPRAAHAI